MLGISLVGTKTLGTATAGTDKVVQLCVNGEDVTGILLSGSLEITDNVSSRSTCDFELLDESKVRSYQTGESVVVNWHGARIFAGSEVDLRCKAARAQAQ